MSAVKSGGSEWSLMLGCFEWEVFQCHESRKLLTRLQAVDKLSAYVNTDYFQLISKAGSQVYLRGRFSETGRQSDVFFQNTSAGQINGYRLLSNMLNKNAVSKRNK
jgi:hypothetical protein